MQELVRANVTKASRIMLPLYAVVVAVFGWAYVTDPKGNMNVVPGLAAPREMMNGTMRPWGYMFLAIALLMAVAMLSHRRFLMAVGLALGFSLWMFWGALAIRSSVLDAAASPIGFVLPWGWAFAHFASLVSVYTEEHS